MFAGLFKTAKHAFDQAMKDADQGDRGGRRWDVQISGCTTVLARDLDPGTRSDILRKRGDAYYLKMMDNLTNNQGDALSNFALDDYEEAIRLNRNNALAYCGRAEVRLRLGHWKSDRKLSELSMDDYNEAIRLDPTLAKAYYGRAISWGDDQRKRYFEDIDKAISLDGRKYAYIGSRALVRGRSGDFRGAIEDLSRMIELWPEAGRHLEERAVLHEKEGLLDKALADLNMLLKRAEDDWCRRLNLVGRAGVYIKQGQLNRAIDDCNRAFNISEKSKETWAAANALNTRGVAHSIQGNITQAMNDYSEAIRLCPNLSVAFANRGDLYEKQGRLKEALNDFDSACSTADQRDFGVLENFVPTRAPNGTKPSESYKRVKEALAV